MKTQSPDTHPEIERIVIEGYRKMTPAEKMGRMQSMCDAMEAMAVAQTRRRHPDASNREILLRVASRRIAPELMAKAFGWDVKKEGY